MKGDSLAALALPFSLANEPPTESVTASRLLTARMWRKLKLAFTKAVLAQYRKSR